MTKLRDENSSRISWSISTATASSTTRSSAGWSRARNAKNPPPTFEATAKAEGRKLTEAEIERIKSLRAYPRNRDKNGQPTGPQIKQVTSVYVRVWN